MIIVELTKKLEITLEDFESDNEEDAVRRVEEMLRDDDIVFDELFDATTIDIRVLRYDGTNPFPVGERRKTIYAN